MPGCQRCISAHSVEFSARTEIKRVANFTKKQKAPQTDSDKRQPAYECNLQKNT